MDKFKEFVRARGALRSLTRLFALTLVLRFLGETTNALLVDTSIQLGWLDTPTEGLFVALIAMTNPMRAHNDDTATPEPEHLTLNSEDLKRIAKG